MRNNRYFICDFETTGLDRESRPIEIGIIICDENFAVLETFERLIDWTPPAEYCILTGSPIDPKKTTWSEEELRAFVVHKIMPAEIYNFGSTPQAVADRVKTLARKHTLYGKKPILVSDNIVFEWMHLNNILEGKILESFHYCGWDTSLFLEATGVGDPRNVPHRALADCGRIHKAICEAMDRTRGLRS